MAEPNTADATANAAADTQAAVDAALAKQKADSQAIAEYCAMAGQSHLTAKYLAAGATPDQVRTELLATAAARTNANPIHGTTEAAAGTGATENLEENPMVLSAKRMAARLNAQKGVR